VYQTILYKINYTLEAMLAFPATFIMFWVGCYYAPSTIVLRI